MRPSTRFWTAIGGWLLTAWATQAAAQQTHMTVRNNSINDNFYEQMGTSWGLNWHGINMRFGSPGLTQPAFGGFQPGTGGSLATTFQGPGYYGYFNLYGAQGSSRTATNVASSLTTMNGQPGFISDTSQSPFVIGVVPVVGGFPGEVTLPWQAMAASGSATTVQLPTFSQFSVGTSVNVPAGGGAAIGGINRAGEMRNEFGAPGLPAAQAAGGQRGAANVRAMAAVHDLGEMDRQILAGATAASAATAPHPSADTSSATRAAPSVTEARRLYEADQAGADGELTQWFEHAQTAEAQGKAGAARVYYQMVARKATGDLKSKAIERLQSLRAETSKGTVIQNAER